MNKFIILIVLCVSVLFSTSTMVEAGGFKLSEKKFSLRAFKNGEADLNCRQERIREFREGDIFSNVVGGALGATLNNFAGGSVNLGIKCSIEQQLLTLFYLEEIHDWHAIASIIYERNFGSELTYYYLGRAAEGLGATEAAFTYYEKAADKNTPACLVVAYIKGIEQPIRLTWDNHPCFGKDIATLIKAGHDRSLRALQTGTSAIAVTE